MLCVAKLRAFPSYGPPLVPRPPEKGGSTVLGIAYSNILRFHFPTSHHTTMYFRGIGVIGYSRTSDKGPVCNIPYIIIICYELHALYRIKG